MVPSYDSWMESFMESWKNLEGGKTTEFLSKNVQYYETPDGEPCESWMDVLELWKVVPQNQKNITYAYKILCATEEMGIINWRMTRVFISDGKEIKQRIDGIFQVSLDEKGLCNYFKQWRYTAVEGN